jgi:hypothetical protein
MATIGSGGKESVCWTICLILAELLDIIIVKQGFEIKMSHMGRNGLTDSDMGLRGPLNAAAKTLLRLLTDWVC